MPTVLLVRHALSVWNLEGRWQGQADPALSAEGEEQAQMAAAAVGDVDLVISSDLERARRTAAILAPRVDHFTDPVLREFDVGAWSGCTRAEIELGWRAELEMFDAGRLEAPPGGERRSDFEARVRRAATRISELAMGVGAARTLVVTHGGVVRTLARMQSGTDRHVGHLCGYETEVKRDSLVVIQPVDLLREAPETEKAGRATAF